MLGLADDGELAHSSSFGYHPDCTRVRHIVLVLLVALYCLARIAFIIATSSVAQNGFLLTVGKRLLLLAEA